MKNNRNFSIIAHIDHGKSTLADRFIEICNKNYKDKDNNCLLDSMDLEKERGITIKSHCLTLYYKDFKLNLIDTPGHVDFSYEVLRFIDVCDGAVLLIDATQGVQAQTMSNYEYLLKKNKHIIVALNKIDLLDRVKKNIKEEVEDFLKKKVTIKNISAKTGFGVKDLINTIIDEIPPPKILDHSFKAIVVDSWFDNFSGVICLLKILSGSIFTGKSIKNMHTNIFYKINSIGIFQPDEVKVLNLNAGDFGFVSILCKNYREIIVGDFFSDKSNKEIIIRKDNKFLTRIYSTLYPRKIEHFSDIKKAIVKLTLNDPALIFKIIKSPVFGFGLECGFLGMLHLDIVKERLKREYFIETFNTPPNVIFKLILKNKKIVFTNNLLDQNLGSSIKNILEPVYKCFIVVQSNVIGRVITFLYENRCYYHHINESNSKAFITCHIPVIEVFDNFFDRLKSITSGVVSFNYSFENYIMSNIILLKILINGKEVPGFFITVHESKAKVKSDFILKLLSKNIKRQLFNLKLQISNGKKVISSFNLPALRKNVLSKCYGGDISRKKKLIKKQKEGKKRMKKISNFNIQKDIFRDISF